MWLSNGPTVQGPQDRIAILYAGATSGQERIVKKYVRIHQEEKTMKVHPTMQTIAASRQGRQGRQEERQLTNMGWHLDCKCSSGRRL